MKDSNDKSKSEKIIFILASPPAWFFILIISIMMVVGILYSVMKTSDIYFDPSPDGWNTFWDLFKAPISVFVGGTTIFGILVALRRTIQNESQLKTAQNQYNIVKQNTYISTYFKFMEEFIKTMKEYRGSVMLWGSQGSDFDETFYRKLFKCFYGTEFKSNYKISNEILDEIQFIIDETLKLFSQKLKTDTLIAEKLANLGFLEKTGKRIGIGDNTIDSRLADSLKLIIIILEFSNQRSNIKNIDELLEILNL